MSHHQYQGHNAGVVVRMDLTKGEAALDVPESLEPMAGVLNEEEEEALTTLELEAEELTAPADEQAYYAAHIEKGRTRSEANLKKSTLESYKPMIAKFKAWAMSKDFTDGATVTIQKVMAYYNETLEFKKNQEPVEQYL